MDDRKWVKDILTGWGDWRARTDAVLSTGSQSPIASIIGENSGKLYGVNKQKEHIAQLNKYHQIKKSLEKIGYVGDNLIDRTRKELKEWKVKRDLIPQPKETRETKPKTPGYNGHKYYSKIDKMVYELNPVYRNILIKKYEHLWIIDDFMQQMGWERNTAWTRISEATKEIRVLLKKSLKNK